MIRILLLFLWMAGSILSSAQGQKKFNIYKPGENAEQALQKVVAQASLEKKHVLVQVGGNWCVWCAKFYYFSIQDTQVDSLIKSSYKIYHLNYSKENKNLQMLAKYSFPQRFGFPVFLILDGNGKLLHTQNSAYLEGNEGYDKEKVMDFLSAWNRDALNPATYQ